MTFRGVSPSLERSWQEVRFLPTTSQTIRITRTNSVSNSNSTDLTVEQLREVFHYDPETGVFTRRVQTSNKVKAGDTAGSLTGMGYLYIRLGGKPRLAHRLAWLYVHGEWPEKHIDHINRIRTDNRICNLRLASCSESNQNTGLSRRNKSGHKGVVWHKAANKWCAQIRHQHRQIYLGVFDDINDAIAARKAAEQVLHPFATT